MCPDQDSKAWLIFMPKNCLLSSWPQIPTIISTSHVYALLLYELCLPDTPQHTALGGKSSFSLWKSLVLSCSDIRDGDEAKGVVSKCSVDSCRGRLKTPRVKILYLHSRLKPGFQVLIESWIWTFRKIEGTQTERTLWALVGLMRDIYWQIMS